MQWTPNVPVQLMAWTMALCPVGLAILCHTGLRSEPLSIKVPNKPALAFNQYSVDLRTIHPTTVVEASYVFQNLGSEPVRITKIETSCGCLTPHLQGARDNVIDAGGQGRVIIRMQPGNTTPGKHDYAINVRYTDSEPRDIQLLLRMDIPATVWVTPPVMSFYHPRGSQPTPAEFKVSDGRGKPFDITNVSVNTDLVEAIIGESGRTVTGNYQQSVHISVAGKLPPGRSQYTLRIQTNDVEVPELRVPILLEGEADSESEQALDHEQPDQPQQPVKSETETVQPRNATGSNEAEAAPQPPASAE